jgi:hypothetical protein
MRSIQCAAQYALSLLLALSVSAASLGTCFGAEKVPNDLALLKSFTIPRDDLGVSQVAYKVGFSENAELIACCSGQPGWRDSCNVFLWDVKTGRRVPANLDLPTSRGAVSFQYGCATIPYARLYFWTFAGLEVQDNLTKATKEPIQLSLLGRGVAVEGRLRFSIEGEQSVEMGRAYFSANGDYIAALRFDKSLHVWNTRSGKHVGRFALPAEISSPNAPNVRSVAFDPTNRYLAAGLDLPPKSSEGRTVNGKVIVWGRVIVWDLKSREEVLHAREEYRVFQVAFSKNGELMSAEGAGGPDGLDKAGRISIRQLQKLGDARRIDTACGAMAIAVVPGIGIVTGGWDGRVSLWDGQTGELLAVGKDRGKHVESLAVSQDGKLIASGDWDSVVRIWQIRARPR